jgi:hypothetical protein
VDTTVPKARSATRRAPAAGRSRSRAPFLGRRQITIVGAAVGVAVLLLAGVLLSIARSTPHQVSSSDAAPAAMPPPEQTWRDVMASLDSARDHAFEQADEAALAAVDAAGSPAYSQDVALMRQMVGHGGRAAGLHQEIIDLSLREAGSQKSVLRVTDRLPPYTYVDAAGRVLARQPGHDRRQWDITLVSTDQGWRIAAVDGVG